MERTKPCNCNHSDRYKTYLGLIDTKVDTTIKSFNYKLKKIKDSQLRKSTFANEVGNLRKIFDTSITKAELAEQNTNVLSFPRINFNYVEEIGILEQLRGEARRFINKEKLVKEFHSQKCAYLEYYNLNENKYLYPYIHWYELVYPYFIRLSKDYTNMHKSEINWNIYKLDDDKIKKLYTLLVRHKWIEINWRYFKLIFNGKPKSNEMNINWKSTPAALLNLMFLLRELYFPSENNPSLYRFVKTFSTIELSNSNRVDQASQKDKKIINSIEKALKS
jgi:hypothetical protein